MEVLEELGLPVEQLHGESAPGQFEVVTTHNDPLEARTQPQKATCMPYNPSICIPKFRAHYQVSQSSSLPFLLEPHQMT